MNKAICIQSNIAGSGDRAKQEGGGYIQDRSFTLTGRDRHAVCFEEREAECFLPQAGASRNISYGKKAGALTAGQIQGCVIKDTCEVGGFFPYAGAKAGSVSFAIGKVPTIQAGNCPYIVFKERCGKPGGGKGILINREGGVFTIATRNDQVICLANDGGVRSGCSTKEQR